MKQMISLVLGLLVGAPARLPAQNLDNTNLLNIHTIGSSGPAIKAMRDFWERAGDGKQEKWYKTNNGFLVEFEEGGIQGRYLYDSKGHWVYSIRTFGEKGLPEEVRKLVRSTYFDYTIRWVKEVSEWDVLAYIVHIENETSWKELVVRDGEMREREAFDK